MLPDRVSNPGSLTYESGALPIEKTVQKVFNIHALDGSISSFYSSKFDLTVNQIFENKQCRYNESPLCMN